MVELMNFGAGVFAVAVATPIEKQEVSRALAALDQKAADGTRLRLYAEIRELNLMHVMSLAQDLSSFADRRHLLHQFDRAAIVTDSVWVAQAMQFTRKAPTGLEVRLFSMAAQEMARLWIDGT